METVKKGKCTYYIYQDYVYMVTRIRRWKTYLVCFRRKQSGHQSCRAHLVWDTDVNEMTLMHPHNHPAPDEDIVEIRFRSLLSKLSQNSSLNGSVSDLINEATSLDPAGKKLMKSKRGLHLRRVAYRFFKNASIIPSNISENNTAVASSTGDAVPTSDVVPECARNSGIDEPGENYLGKENTVPGTTIMEVQVPFDNRNFKKFTNDSNSSYPGAPLNEVKLKEEPELVSESSCQLPDSKYKKISSECQKSTLQRLADDLIDDDNFEHISPEATFIFQNLCLLEFLRKKSINY